MKKSLILLSICSAVLLTSCGTSSYYASSAFEDGIYYRPSGNAREEARADSREVQELISRTRQEAARFSDTIVIASANSTVDVPYVPDTQYTLMFDNQLDSLGQVNLNFDFDFYDWYPGYGYRDYYSYWDWRYWDVFGPSWYRWGMYSPWYGWGWYDPWHCGWGFGFGFAWDPWYGPWGGWYAGWYGPGYWGWYDPWYWGYPVASFYPTYAYYGKRNTGLRTGSGVIGGRTLASAGGSSLRSGGRTATPSMSVVRGSASSGRNTASGRTFQARPTGAGSSVNMGERYVSRGSLRANATSYRTTAADGRTAYNSGSAFRRPSTGTASTYRRPATSRSESFRSPFENRTSFNVSTGRDNTGFSRGTTYNSRSSISRSSYGNTTTRSSFSTGSYSRSSMGGGRSYGGGGGRSGGGGGRR